MKRSGVTGHVELARALREVAKGPSVAEIDKAAEVAMGPMLKKSRDRFKILRNYFGKWLGFPQPNPTRKGGHVDEGIVFRKHGKQGKMQRFYRLGAVRRARYLLHLLEFGSHRHWQPRFRGGWMHPGARPHPTLIPTFEEERGKVSETFGRKIGEALASRIGLITKATRSRR